MPDSSAVRELAEKRQRTIVEEASSVPFEEVLHRASIRDIVTAREMSIGRLYRGIFPKDDIPYFSMSVIEAARPAARHSRNGPIRPGTGTTTPGPR